MEASTINQVHPDDDPGKDEADRFFDEGEDGDELEATSVEDEPATAKAEEDKPEPEQTPDSQPEFARPSASAQTENSSPASQAATDGGGEEQSSSTAKQRGNVDREYTVFQRVPLTAKVLKHLLDELAEGQVAEPKAAFIEIHRGMARSVNAAVLVAYTENQDSLGEKADLAAVSSRSFQARRVEPKKKVETAVSIT